MSRVVDECVEENQTPKVEEEPDEEKEWKPPINISYETVCLY